MMKLFKTDLVSELVDAWYAKRKWLYCLQPIAGIFQAVAKARYYYYQTVLSKQVKQFPVPIIVVGNIAVGGSGKTPLVIWLANFLKAQGFKPGIVSRGYGGKRNSEPLPVTVESDVKQVGDEALLIAQHTHCPMVVAIQRVHAVQCLLQQFPECNVIISDDGLQHYALARDIEIAVIDGARRLGNGLCLPAGPLREPPSRLASVDFVVSNGAAEPSEYLMRLNYATLHNVANPEITKTFDQFKDKKVHAIAGIGNPERFFQLLRQQGLVIEAQSFPDHFSFTVNDINFDENALVIMTEKDAVKCRQFADHRHWYLPVQAELSQEFADAFLAKLKTI
jgi:tetraacyldisaccharide 4'-kinase